MPSLCEDLLSSIDQPLKMAKDKATGRDYLLCDYNRDGDSYRSGWLATAMLERCALTRHPARSPWSNTYEPALPDGAMPSEKLRQLEITANSAFDAYREVEDGMSFFPFAFVLWSSLDGR